MNKYSLSLLSDQVVTRGLAALDAKERTVTAEWLAYLAEVDARRLYLPAGYSSMYDYCVHELRRPEDSICNRIRAARTAWKFPAIFPALAYGRLHLSAVVMLAPHLAPDTADELLAVTAHKTKAEIKQLLAQRFPQPDVPSRITALSTPSPLLTEDPLAPGPTNSSAPGRIETPRPRATVTPLSPRRFAVQFTMSQSGYDQLEYAQTLLGHALPSGDVGEVFERSLNVFVRHLEKRKFAATAKPRSRRRPATASERYVPAHVKRTVWERDQGQCTFVSEAGRRCTATHRLEFDHIEPVARGGRATVEGIRLRCRAHNQYEAERMFGAEFMRHKREQAREAAEARAQAAAQQQAAARERADATEKTTEQDVVPWLLQLGFRAGEAREAARLCESIHDAPLEERVRVALSFFHPRGRSHGRATHCLGAAA
jgi:5-methylcytosine-specific restriction endonuclease McrA